MASSSVSNNIPGPYPPAPGAAMMAGVKYATAVRRLQSLAEVAQDFRTRLHPEDHLWRAAEAVHEIEAALAADGRPD